jgi:hypothetical protein
MAFIGDINREPVVHTWRYKIDNAASSPYIRYFGNVVLGMGATAEGQSCANSSSVKNSLLTGK